VWRVRARNGRALAAVGDVVAAAAAQRVARRVVRTWVEVKSAAVKRRARMCTAVGNRCGVLAWCAMRTWREAMKRRAWLEEVSCWRARRLVAAALLELRTYAARKSSAQVAWRRAVRHCYRRRRHAPLAAWRRLMRSTTTLRGAAAWHVMGMTHR
jgi:hypothetical protein